MVENLANLHVMGVTSDGAVWHTMRSPTSWTPFFGLPNLPGAGAGADVVDDGDHLETATPLRVVYRGDAEGGASESRRTTSS